MKTDIEKLLRRLDDFLFAAEKARGSSSGLVKAAPLEIHFYNLATDTMNNLKHLRALLQDANGTYLKEKK